MKKLAGLLATGAFLLSAATVLAAPDKSTPKSPADYNGLTRPGKAQHLYLYEKDPTDWTFVERGAWGKVTYKADKFVFNSPRLQPDTEYTLVRYTDPWPGQVVCLGSGNSNDGRHVILSGEWKAGGPKVWLVLSSDVNCETGMMTGWHPTEYLFEYDLIDGPVYVNFLQGATNYDSWWTMSGDTAYESRSDGYFEFHPLGAACDPTNLSASFNWTFNYAAYTDLGGDVGDLTDYLVPGNQYHVCRYPSAL